MKIKEAVRAMIKRRGITVEKVATILNYRTVSGLQNRLYSKNGVRSNLLCTIADACEFDIVLRDRLSEMEIYIDKDDEVKKGEDEDGSDTSDERRDMED